MSEEVRDSPAAHRGDPEPPKESKGREKDEGSLIPGAAHDFLNTMNTVQSAQELLLLCRGILRALDRVPLFSGDDRRDHGAVFQLFHFHNRLKAEIEACMQRKICGNTMLAAPLSGLLKLHLRMQDPVSSYRERLDLTLLMLKTGCPPDEIRLATQIAHILIFTTPSSKQQAEDVKQRRELASALLGRAESGLRNLGDPEKLHMFNSGMLSCDLCPVYGTLDLCSSEPSTDTQPQETAASESSSQGGSGTSGGLEGATAEEQETPAPAMTVRMNGSAVCVGFLQRRLGTLFARQGMLPEAAAQLKGSLRLLQDHLSPTHPSYLELPITMVSLSMLLTRQGELEGQALLAAARPLFLKAPEATPRLWKDDRFVEEYAKYLNLYACAMGMKNDTSTGVAASEASKQVLPANGPEVEEEPEQEEDKLSEVQRFAKAKDLGEEAIALLESRNSSLHHDAIMKCCTNMGQICEDHGDLVGAEKYYRKALIASEGLGREDRKHEAKKVSSPPVISKERKQRIMDRILILNKVAEIAKTLSESEEKTSAERAQWAQKSNHTLEIIRGLEAEIGEGSSKKSPVQQGKKTSSAKVCAGPNCGLPDTPAVPLKRCSACRGVWYCGSACQKKHFKHGHREECQRIAAEGQKRPKKSKKKAKQGRNKGKSQSKQM